MNTHGFAARPPLTAASKTHVHLPRVSAREMHAWLNEPARCEPLPVVSLMYGFQLRPVDQPDIGRRA
jgi:hypothetical protein